ncbi:MAG TPA: kinase [Bdellovibrionota bacterium]|nr:kinase [Bdellovibrionota bacterium]
MIISRTPYRISFFGGGTDYPVWYREHSGAVLSTSINKYCYITCRYLPPFFNHHSHIVYSRVEAVQSNDEIEHPAVREALKYLSISDGVEIHHDGDLPARTGLGSSSSFTVGLLHSLYALKQQMVTKMQLATEAIHMERDILKEHVGSQDQACAAFGGFNRISFSTDDRLRVDPVIIHQERLWDLENHLMLFFTGFSRIASHVAKKQIQNTKMKSSELQTMYEMVEEAITLLAGNSDISAFGELLHEGWLLKRSLSDAISTSDIDEIYSAARESGAIGGKLLGAGGGGFMLLFVPPEDQAHVRERLNDLLHVPFRFEAGGSQVIFYDPNAYKHSDHPLFSNQTLSARPQELVWAY